MYLLWVLGLSSLPLGVNLVYTSVLRVTDRIKELVGVWAFIAVATIGLSYWLMSAVGIIGVGYAWLAVQSLVTVYVVSHTLNRWVCHNKVREKSKG